MNAIETEGLSKSFHGLYAVKDLNMHVPEGAIYGFIGENGSGKSTTEKLLCGLLVPRRGSRITLYGRPHTDPAVRARIGTLIENPACFPDSTVWDNMMMQAINLGVRHPAGEIRRVLELMHMGGAAKRKFRQCSLGMKQRIGVAQALMGHPRLLILDEPINGLDADGMRIVRETLVGLNRSEGVTILISSHILGELGKMATHYGILRGGTLIREMPAAAIRGECRDFVFVKTNDDLGAFSVLRQRYASVEAADGGIRVYDADDSAEIAAFLFQRGIAVREIARRSIGLEDYYISIMSKEAS